MRRRSSGSVTSAQSISFSLLLLFTFAFLVGGDKDDFLELCELFRDMLLDIVSMDSRFSRVAGEGLFLFRDIDLCAAKDVVASGCCCCSCSSCACKGARLSWGVSIVNMSALTLLSNVGEVLWIWIFGRGHLVTSTHWSVVEDIDGSGSGDGWGRKGMCIYIDICIYRVSDKMYGG